MIPRAPVGGTIFRQLHETFDLGDGLRTLELLFSYKNQTEETGEFDKATITFHMNGVETQTTIPFDVFDALVDRYNGQDFDTE